MTTSTNKFSAILSYEIAAKLSVFLILPISSYVFLIEDVARISFFINAVQALLPAIGLGLLSVIPIREFRSKDIVYTLLIFLVIFQLALNLGLYFYLGNLYSFIIPASLCALLVFIGQFNLLEGDRKSLFLSLFFYRILSLIALLSMFLLPFQAHFQYFIIVYSALLFSLLFYVVWRDIRSTPFRIDLPSAKAVALKGTVYIPVVLNSCFSFFFLFFPKLIAGTSASSTIVYLSYGQYIQSLFLLLSSVFIKHNLSVIYTSAVEGITPLSSYVESNLVYLLLFLTCVFLSLIAFVSHFIQIADFLPYAVAYLLLILFQLLYICSNDYLIAKGRGMIVLCLMVLSVLFAFLMVKYINFDSELNLVLMPLVFNALFFGGVFCVAFWDVGFGFVLKRLTYVLSFSVIVVIASFYLIEYAFLFTSVGMLIALIIFCLKKHQFLSI